MSSVCTTQLYKRGELGLLPYKRGELGLLPYKRWDAKKSPFSKGGFRGIFGRSADSLATNITQVAQKLLSGERFKMVSMGIFY